MTPRKQSWKTVARRVLGKKAIENGGEGDGQFVLVTPCRNQIDFSLWTTRESAEKCKRRLDRGGCWPKTHYIVDLSQVIMSKK